MTNVIALIPARAGSKRCPAKNVRDLAGHPLLAYAIGTAQEAGIFTDIAVSSDSPETLAIAEAYGARAVLRPAALATDYSPDIAWVNHAIETVEAESGQTFDAFAILRPTSPFRRGAWVKKAWDAFANDEAHCDSLRAMRPVSEHPGKMWRLGSVVARPLLPFEGMDAPWHSLPTQELPRVYVQTAALEIAWTAELPRSIAGDIVLPWLCDAGDAESYDVNSETDWAEVVALAAAHPEWLPPVKALVAV